MTECHKRVMGWLRREEEETKQRSSFSEMKAAGGACAHAILAATPTRQPISSSLIPVAHPSEHWLPQQQQQQPKLLPFLLARKPTELFY
jgi:hypothetical protein